MVAGFKCVVDYLFDCCLWFDVVFVVSYLGLCSRLLLVFVFSWNDVVVVVCIMFGGCCLGL